MKVTGYYDEFGYEIEIDGHIVYSASNHALDSQQDGTDTEHQLPLDTLQEFCGGTAKDIAEEKQAEFVGIVRRC